MLGFSEKRAPISKYFSSPINSYNSAAAKAAAPNLSSGTTPHRTENILSKPSTRRQNLQWLSVGTIPQILDRLVHSAATAKAPAAKKFS